MATNKIIENPANKVFDKASAVSYQKLSAVQQISIETEWTNHIQNLVDFGNKRLLRNFSLRLEMDDDEPEMHRQSVYQEKGVNP